MQWDSPKTGFFDDSIKRTLALADAIKNAQNYDALKTPLESCGNVIQKGNVMLNVRFIIDNAVIALRNFPEMLQYKFRNDDKSLERIEVHSHVNRFKQFSTKKQDICANACLVHAAIKLFIERPQEIPQENTTTFPYSKPQVVLTHKLENSCGYSTQPVGGSKSKHRRRRHSRRKLRAKTHKRRRH